MTTRTDALLSQQETGKITASIIPVMPGCHPALIANNPHSERQFRHPSDLTRTRKNRILIAISYVRCQSFTSSNMFGHFGAGAAAGRWVGTAVKSRGGFVPVPVVPGDVAAGRVSVATVARSVML